MKKMVFAVLAASALAVAAGGQALAASKEDPAAQGSRDVSKDMSGSASDAWLTAKAKAALAFHSGVSATDTEVESRNGVVTLRGTAESEDSKALATEYVRKVDGVKEVRNEMRVFGPMMGRRGPKDGTTDTEFGTGYPPVGTGSLPGQGEPVDDATITASVRSALSADGGMVPDGIRTDSGVVTLKGHAKSAEEKDRISRRVSGIRGVASVRNEMTIAGSGPGKDLRDLTLTGQQGVYAYPARPAAEHQPMKPQP